MKNENVNDATKKEINLSYYLKHTGNPEIMSELRWENPSLYLLVRRLDYILSFSNKEPIYKCPECGADIEVDKDLCEEYCTRCGLVTRNDYPYVASQKYILPYGIRL